ncbi:hypothetical protein AKJ64_01890 [candidate division MSBL1 archaeon SCGC-AAA259E17]|uniref:Uncharacterized protein n=1 Tax=candidate division MSBL1 archaeon SCGC-AAA259E17 TaxID=1698263 RepID=A0A133UFG2_9EURY|nr:hypothetical protein AKJ64_01890 [candidate division MSBL1 archaeon SCGC-AAA259E17]
MISILIAYPLTVGVVSVIVGFRHLFKHRHLHLQQLGELHALRLFRHCDVVPDDFIDGVARSSTLHSHLQIGQLFLIGFRSQSPRRLLVPRFPDIQQMFKPIEHSRRILRDGLYSEKLQEILKLILNIAWGSAVSGYLLKRRLL